jgi:hypothetical protein
MTQPEADVVSHDSPNGMSVPVHSFAPDMDEPPPPPLPKLARRRLPMVTLVLALLAFGAVGFLVGVKVEKTKLPASNTATTTGARATALPGGPAATASAGPSGAAAAGPSGAAAAPTGTGSSANIVGTVAVVDGTTLYVTDTSGNTVKVTTNTGTTVTKTVTGAVKDLAPGETVVVRGVQSSVGVYAAQSVIQGAPGGGGFGGGGFGGGGGRGRASAAPSASAGNG